MRISRVFALALALIAPGFAQDKGAPSDIGDIFQSYDGENIHRRLLDAKGPIFYWSCTLIVSGSRGKSTLTWIFTGDYDLPGFIVIRNSIGIRIDKALNLLPSKIYVDGEDNFGNEDDAAYGPYLAFPVGVLFGVVFPGENLASKVFNESGVPDCRSSL